MKTALVTGASRGIGLAIATILAQNGYHLHLTCKNSYKQLKDIAKSLSETYNITCRAHKTDMGNFAEVWTLFSNIDSLDVLINNAGISHIGLLQDTTVDEWQKVIDTNLSSVFFTSKMAIPKLLENKSGTIINISSIWGDVGASMEVAYSASKGGVNAFTKALAKELAPSNIAVNAISCGVIDTDMNKCFSKNEMAALIEEIPANRLGTPQEVAELTMQLINSPKYLTGQIISINGGF
ncbi:MAG: SDR family NAD(P)-dependent oxidoreductase [Lachnospiraceae bacterium]|nr:SDR family NAD(P)-dependent oxidoreductase [Lachnospiraceae bacterium]